ncbi:uracil-DNA glycosylase family protein [Synechococcus sp. CS-1325]|uniref:uracil-DNA glycosylase family protein n=1 Tax=Synechococcus sp. CS-1325 TaxID=2847979 RepID=UPI000DB78B75|nr:uracil-DNA glycosylase family protein [Synechococcus sp. CS-1325]MCT0198658.1 uracil-DNA glycosylase family protein [Synechococcus sp. CS-1325]PZV02099.1 MAG: hypothetical protein DCF24_02530 [Cyanobium sp.]
MTLTKYQDLVACRKNCRLCTELKNPAETSLAVHDSDQIGPWSRLAADLCAEVLVVGQDWGDVRYFKENKGVDLPLNPTTNTLRCLLQILNRDLPSKIDSGKGSGIFLTNAILCLKDGGMQSKVHREWFDNCGKHFLLPLIELISPVIVVTLGEMAYRTVVSSYELRPSKFRDAVETEGGVNLPGGRKLFPVYHCGQRILNTHRKKVVQIEDWKRIRRYLDQGRPA